MRIVFLCILVAGCPGIRSCQLNFPGSWVGLVACRSSAEITHAFGALLCNALRKTLEDAPLPNLTTLSKPCGSQIVGNDILSRGVCVCVNVLELTVKGWYPR